MKYTLIVFSLLLSFTPLFSQKDTAQFYNKTLCNNNLSVELGGKGFLYSVGYERTLYKSKKNLFTACINLSLYNGEGVVPIGVNLFCGKKQNKFLLGVNISNVFNFNPYPKSSKERLALLAAHQEYRPLYDLGLAELSIGYRKYFKKGNSLTISFNPIILGYEDAHFSIPNLASFWFWPGIIGINYNLKLRKKN